MSENKKSQEPSRYLVKLSTQFFQDDSLRQDFISKVNTGHCAVPSLILLNENAKLPIETLPSLELQPSYIFRVKDGERPGRTAEHERGDFYLFDFASVLMCLPMASIPLEQPEVLDLCASPGGKSVFAWRALKPSRLVSNEVVGKRTVQLKSNLKRCHIDAEVKSLTAETYVSDGQTFDVIIVDAPCSGQSLLAKGETAPGCFHPSNVNGCMKRQRRIVANAAQCVRDGGYLLYSTCTYSPEENEEVVEWLLKKFPEFKTVEVPLLRNFQSRLTEEKCYRFFPDKDYGAGGFTALLKKG